MFGDEQTRDNLRDAPITRTGHWSGWGIACIGQGLRRIFMLFRVGKVSISTAILESQITPAELIGAFERYIRGDWGDDTSADLHNDLAIANGARIVATYVTLDGVQFSITTLAGRTQILFPEEAPALTGEAIA